MRHFKAVWAVPLLCLPLTPVLAQPPVIGAEGGGVCSSATVKGMYAVMLSGRQISSSSSSGGTFTNVFQANGTATFDGLSAVTLALTTDTIQAVATTAEMSGTYTVQANCAGSIAINSGGSATFHLAIYNSGAGFAITGNDATYSYSGSGNTTPSACSLALLSGVYAFTSTGFGISSSAVSAGEDITGLLQFDGQGHATVNANIASASGSSLTLTGTYSMSSSCLGSATLTDASGNSYVMSLSVYSGNSAASTDFYVTLAQTSKFMVSGAAHAVYGQPTASLLPAVAQTISGGTCSAATLNGTYSLVLSGRGISSTGAFTGGYDAVGTSTFDGKSAVTFTGTVDTNLAEGKAFTYSGTYTISSTCMGTITLTSGSAATFTLVAWGSASNPGLDFAITGTDANYVYSGSGAATMPPLCATATISGEYVYQASGFTLSGTAQTGALDESGVLQFDGQGNVTASYTSSPSGAVATASGTYTVASNCVGSATVKDSSGIADALNFTVTTAHGQDFTLLEASSDSVRAGTGHAAFVSPDQAIGNVASYALDATPPGSVFALFGSGFAAGNAQAVSVPLPTTLGTTSVTVNGEMAPLFYVDPQQIDVQMPWDIPGGSVATIIVKYGSAASNAAAVYVPLTGTPGISTYGSSRAVVTNSDGSLNSSTNPASVGDEVVAYFTGGGPVNASGKLVTGAAAPSGLSPVTGANSVTVGGTNATVDYMGLTPGGIGLYQANFIVPTLSKGTYAVQITIAGFASNSPLITIGN
jgi:uncharacterized protein (TIGR03437 family)